MIISHSSAYYTETLVGFGMGLTVAGTVVSAIGLWKMLQKEEQQNQKMSIDLSGSSCSHVRIINFDLKSNTAKGTLCTIVGVGAFCAGITCILKSFK